MIKDGINVSLNKLSNAFFGITSNDSTKQNFINAKEEFFHSNSNNSSSSPSSPKNNFAINEFPTLSEENKTGLALRGQILHKRRMINEYIVPICYLIYSFIFMKYYYFQKRRAVKVVGDVSYKMYEYMFDYKNPIIKKVNVFIYNNVKDSFGRITNNTSTDYDPELFKKLQDYRTNCSTHFDKIKKAISEKENLDINFKIYKNVVDLLKNLIGDMHKIILLMVQIYKDYCIEPGGTATGTFKKTTNDKPLNIRKIINLDEIIYLAHHTGSSKVPNFSSITIYADLEKILTTELKNILDNIFTYNEINTEQDENFIVKINRMIDVTDYKIYESYKNQYRIIVDTYQNMLKTVQKINLEKVEIQISNDKEEDFDELLLDETSLNLRKIFQVYKYYKEKYDTTFKKKEEEKKTISLLDYIKKNINNQIEIYQDLFNYINKNGKTNLKEVKKEKFEKFYNEINNIYAKINFAILYVLHFNENFLETLEIDNIDKNASNFLRLNFKNKISPPPSPSPSTSTSTSTHSPSKDISKDSKIINFRLESPLSSISITNTLINKFPYILFEKNKKLYEKMDNSFKHLISYLYFSFTINKYTENLYFTLLLNKQEDPITFEKEYADKLIEDIKFQFVNKVRDYKKQNKIKADKLLLFLEQKINKINYENQSVISNINAKEKEYSITKETELLNKVKVRKDNADIEFEKVDKEYIKKSNEKKKMEEFYNNLTTKNSTITKNKLLIFLENVKGYLLSSIKNSSVVGKSTGSNIGIFTNQNIFQNTPILQTGSEVSFDDFKDFIDKSKDINQTRSSPISRVQFQKKTSTNPGVTAVGHIEVSNYKLLEIIFDFFETKFQTLSKANKESKYKDINEEFKKEFLQSPSYDELNGKYFIDYKQKKEDFDNSFMTKNLKKMNNFFIQNETECNSRRTSALDLKIKTMNEFDDIERTIKKKEDRKKLFELKRVNTPVLKKKIEDEVDKITKLKRANNSNTQVDSFKTDFLTFFNEIIEITKLLVEKIDKKSFSKEKNQLYFLYKKDDLYKKRIDDENLRKFTDKGDFIKYWMDDDGTKRNKFLAEMNLYFQTKGEFIVQIKNNYNVKNNIVMPFFENYELEYNDIVSKIKDVLQKINKGMLVLGKNNYTKVDIFINEIIYDKKNKLLKIMDDIKQKQNNYNYNTKNIRGETKVVLPYTDVMFYYFIHLLIIYDYFTFFYE